VTRGARGGLVAGTWGAAALALVLLLVWLPGATAPARAVTAVPGQAGATQLAPQRTPVGAGALEVRITGFEPAVPAPTDTLVVEGTITSTAAQPVDAVRAVLRVSATPLGNRGEIGEVLAGLGSRTGTPVPGASVDVAATLAPGRSVPFRLTAPVAELGLLAPGVYVTGVEALGSLGGAPVRQDLDRTFLPWWPPGTTAQPLLLTTLWPLSAPPAQDLAGVLVDDEVPVSMSPGGRLDTLLGALDAAPGVVTTVVDPLAVQLADDADDGYEVAGAGDGAAAAGSRAAEVAGWLEGLRGRVQDPVAEPEAMLIGGADVVAARRGRLLGAVLGQRTLIDDTTRAALGVDLPQRLVMAPGGAADERTLRTLARAGVSAVVLADTAIPPTTPSFFTPSGNVRVATPSGPLPVLAADSGLSSTLALPMAAADQVLVVRQRLLAETLATITELPDTQRLLVMAPALSWAPSAQGAAMVVSVLGTTPWLVPTSLAAALAREPSSVPRSLAPYGAEQRVAELPAGHLDRVRDQYRGLASYAEVLADPAALDAIARTAPSRGLSGWLRADQALRERLTRRVDSQVGALGSSVRIVSSGSITVAGTSGTIPITVENTGTLPVTVGLRMASTPPQLFSAESVPPFRVDPQRRTSVEVSAQVAAAGPIPVEVQLTTPDGRDFGEPGELTVQSSAYANAAGILVRVALGALVLAVVVHGVRRARRRRRPAPAEEPAPVPVPGVHRG
jgi:hypothetical protein